MTRPDELRETCCCISFKRGVSTCLCNCHRVEEQRRIDLTAAHKKTLEGLKKEVWDAGWDYREMEEDSDIDKYIKDIFGILDAAIARLEPKSAEETK